MNCAMARDPLGGVGAWAGAGAEAGAWASGGNFHAQNAEKSRCMTLMCVKIATEGQMVMNRLNVWSANMSDQDHSPLCAKSVLKVRGFKICS